MKLPEIKMLAYVLVSKANPNGEFHFDVSKIAT